MTSSETNQRAAGAARPSARARFGQVVYLLLAGLFAACIALQVFFAGLAVLVDPGAWEMHRLFGHLILNIPILLLLFGFLARLPWRATGLNLLLLILGISQYVWIYVPGAAGLPALRALHAVNALVLFWLAIYLVQVAVRLLRTPDHGTHRLPVAGRQTTAAMNAER